MNCFCCKSEEFGILEEEKWNCGNQSILKDETNYKGIVQRMSAIFDPKRIYELPALKHNIAAVQLIFESVFHETLSDLF